MEQRDSSNTRISKKSRPRHRPGPCHHLHTTAIDLRAANPLARLASPRTLIPARLARPLRLVSLAALGAPCVHRNRFAHREA
ncbi:hypothetical protein TPAR_04076 [Tolypocladium paradoxum]|uniref:Uncharacterized protein n=1 Tax=Tolypocladium paradoxum TaxID=94208 RepID=A0A2S4KZX0_9HYPO|nr:hypothetical protein TPAR_04076 [Tolypocladium paradoxum]